MEHLFAKGLVQDRPFEEQPCPDATLDDLDPKAVAAFVRRAREERQFPLSEGAAMADVLTHLNLLLGGQPTKAAVLLFGRNPQRFLPSAEVRCMHFHGTEIARPVPFYRIFKGNLFEQVDMALDFVMSKLEPQRRHPRRERAGARALRDPARCRRAKPSSTPSPTATTPPTPPSKSRCLPTASRSGIPASSRRRSRPEQLRHPHSSIARNHRICEALFLARYIEKFGTGTLMMIRESLAHALPEPDFVQRAGEFVTTVWRDWLTEKVLSELGINERQRQAVSFAKAHYRITNADYQGLVGGSRRTALRELEGLVRLGVFILHGRGRGAGYLVAKECAVTRQMRHPQQPPSRPQAASGRTPLCAIAPRMRQTRQRHRWGELQPKRPNEAKGAGKSAINRPNRTSAQTRHKQDKQDATKPASARKRARKGQKG